MKINANTKAKGLLSEVDQGKLLAAYFLYGDEPYKIDEVIARIQKKMFKKADSELSIDRLDGLSSQGNDVLEKLQSFGLFQKGDRLVIVKQAQSLKETDGLLKALSETTKSAEQSPWGSNVLILVASALDSRKKLHQFFKKNGFAFEMSAARDHELAQWAQHLAKKADVKIAADAIDLLCVVCGGSLYRLQTEIEKAKLYADQAPEVTRKHVEAVVSQSVSFEMAELVRAVLEGKKTRALLLSDQIIKGSEEALGFVGFLTWALKNPERFQVSRAWKLQRTRALVGALLDLDSRLKSSGMDAPSLIESFIIDVSARP